MLDLYGQNIDSLRDDITGYSFTDNETIDLMKRIYSEKGYVLDPHGAIGYLGLLEHVKPDKNECGIFLETAHPAKFEEVVSAALGVSIKIPAALEKFLRGTKSTTLMSKEFKMYKQYLLA
jgi:threonine synthase